MIDWLGTGITLFIIFSLILIVAAKVTGDRIIDILTDIRDLMKGEA